MEQALTDKALINLVTEGDEQAFRQFFDRYKHRLFIFVEQLIHSKADAEEIVQETFIKIWQSGHLLKDIDQPGYYIYTIARNKTINYIKKAARDQQLLNKVFANQKDLDNQLEEKLNEGEFKATINKAVQTLNSQQQHIFKLSREEGYTHEQIAQQLGLSKSGVKNIVVETLKQLKDYSSNTPNCCRYYSGSTTAKHYSKIKG